MFNQVGRQSVSLTTFGGLVTEALPNALSEGSSPLCYDVDFLVGSVLTRAGLASQFGSGVNSQNFVWVNTFALQNGQLYTLALAADGTLWQEDVTNNPGTLTQIFQVVSGDLAHGITAFNREYMCFSGHDMPRQYDGTHLDRVSQEGPAAPPLIQTSTQSNPNQATITSFSVASGVATIIAANSFTNGEIVQITCPGTIIDGVIATVSSVSGTQFVATPTNGTSLATTSSTTASGTVVPLTNFAITSITQPAQGTIVADDWGGGPGSRSSGNIYTIYYGLTVDSNLVNLFNSGVAVYVYLTFSGGTTFINGTYKVSGIGQNGLNNAYYYFTCQAPYVDNKINSSVGTYGHYQITMATVTTTVPVPGVSVGSSVNIQGATPTNWNNSWTVVQTPYGGVLNITQTQLASGTATYTYTVQSGSGPVAGDLVTVSNTTGGNGIFNVFNGVIATVGGGTFTITGFTAPDNGPNVESGQAQTVGSIFLIDPGPQFVAQSNQSSPIFGNDSGTGSISFLGNSALSIAAGTRQCCVLFLTRNGYLTKASPTITFTGGSGASAVQVSNIPAGPPNVIARWIAFTEAGANGVPGAYFYVIPQPVQTIVNGQPYTYGSTVINDNTTTSATFSFTDAVLLSSLEIDIQGGNQFAMKELGSSRWNITYSNRMFYGLEENKVTNFLNMSFNGGYLPNPQGINFPLGWTPDFTGRIIATSTPGMFGNTYYVQNTSGMTQSVWGLITQSAFQDSNNVPILQPNTLYSVRVSCRIPSGNTGGTLHIDLTQFNNGSYLTGVGSFTKAFSAMSTSTQIFTGTLLTNAFTTVPSNLLLRVWVENMANNADIEIDHIEVFPTIKPILNQQLTVSYVNNPEAFDENTGVLAVNTTNTQPPQGAFVMYDNLYILKTSSMLQTQDTPGSEPSGWAVREVSDEVGACGPEAYDVGEEWAVTACRSGLYVFYGKQPVKLSQEIFQLWEAINWSAASTIWVRNDIVNRRILIGVPMATGAGTASFPYLPNAPTVSNPTSPNVVLMLNYLGLGDVMALGDGEQMHTTMFGTLMSVDMRRKWTIWNIKSPYAEFITRQDGVTETLMFGNGAGNGKIYAQSPTQLTDDGVTIDSLYTTYGFVDENKKQQNPLLGSHRKQFVYAQMLLSGTGQCTLKVLANNLVPPQAGYSYTTPAITLSAVPTDDLERPLNITGNRVFAQFRTTGSGSAFTLQKLILVGGQALLTLRGSAAQ